MAYALRKESANLVRLICFVVSYFGLTTSCLAQYHPDHPKVKAMVDRGIQYLNDSPATYSQSGEGAVMLVGYTILKATGDTEHPKVISAVSTARQVAISLAGYNDGSESKIVYEASVAALVLANVDAGKYSADLARILYWFQQIQKDHGGFGYLGRPSGDTSQVQYVMLALWTMTQVGIDVPVEVVEKSLQYLRATMDPSGAWGYQGIVSSGAYVAQTQVSKSLATAGIGALIIGGDILGFYGARKKDSNKEDGLPAAFSRVDLIAEARARRKAQSMSRADTDGALTLALRYQNNSRNQGSSWYYYWRYSQERYESFLEVVEGRQEKSPNWYNDGVEELEQAQEENGSWGATKLKSIQTSPAVDTAFAVLFLIRSTQKAIGKLEEGVTFGGYTLPTDVANIKMVGNRIVSDAEASVDSLLEMLEDDSQDVQEGLLPDDLQLSKEADVRKEQVARLSRLIRSEDYRARRVAAKLLGRSEDLDQAPELIFALTDSDPYVPVIAEEGLRLLSRKLKAGKLTPESKPQEKDIAVEFWRDWSLGLRPDYVFVE